MFERDKKEASKRSIKEKLASCFGTKKCDAECEISEECMKTFLLNEKKKKDEKDAKSEKTKDAIKGKFHRVMTSITSFIDRIFSINYWINKIQKFELLAEVIFIDLLMIILLLSIVLSIYFLYKDKWILNLCSIATFISIGIILERLNHNNENRSSPE